MRCIFVFCNDIEDNYFSRSFIKYGKLLESLILKSESLGGRDGTPGDGFGMQKLFLRIRIDSVVV